MGGVVVGVLSRRRCPEGCEFALLFWVVMVAYYCLINLPRLSRLTASCTSDSTLYLPFLDPYATRLLTIVAYHYYLYRLPDAFHSTLAYIYILL